MIKCFVTKISILVIAAASSSSGVVKAVNQIAKPGCQDECGGVKIPFPFGIGAGCFGAAPHFDFEIKCSPTNPKPTLARIYNSEVLSISPEDHTIRVSSRIAYACYGVDFQNGVLHNSNNSRYFMRSEVPFTMSTTRNKLVGIGCDTNALLVDHYANRLYDPDNQYASAACTAYSFHSNNAMGNGTCDPGLGCCEVSILNGGMGSPLVTVSSLSNHSQPGCRDSPCSYAFVGEVGGYSFSATNLTATEENCDKIRVPVVYDWYVRSIESCSRIKNAKRGSPLMICGTNARLECEFEDSYGHIGYHCYCLEGYTGNPYLPQGCKDINECEEEKLNDCERPEYCVNEDGGYVCRCPDRHHGSGTRTSPCFASPGQGKLILGLSIGMSSTISFIILYVLHKLFKKGKEIKARKHNFKKNGGLLLTQEISSNEGAIERTRIFTQSELEKATDNFNDNRELGRGGQGTVYKGMLTDGTIVAVKKSKKVDENQLAQFINEVVILSQINHRNIVKLFGCCLETEVPLLVYEFVPNGTLYQHIHHPSEDFHMTWRVRFQIAMECAMAISYLHSSCSSPIYHRDIKSSNILLDGKYKAKISDFGTSRSISIDKTHVTTCVQGTFGYLDPEFFRSSQFSEKSDVYSFGVVLLELLTSKKPIFTSTSGEPRGLATEFIQILETTPDQLNSFLDTQVLEHCSKEEIEALTMLIERCLSLSVKQRPTMREVAMTLEMVRKQYDEEGNDPSMQGIRRQEGHGVWTNQINMINGGPCSTSSSAFTDGCHSMDVEPLLFDSI